MCQQGPLRYNSEISSYNPPTDRLAAGRPLKHRLPVKPSAVVMVAVFWILLPNQVMMTDMANAQQLSMTILRVNTSCRGAMTRRMRNLKMIMVKRSTGIQVMTVE